MGLSRLYVTEEYTRKLERRNGERKTTKEFKMARRDSGKKRNPRKIQLKHARE